MSIVITTALAVAASVLYASVAEWLLHKYVMHEIFLGFRYPYVAHAQTHHEIFRADASYHLRDSTVAHKIRMAWWNGPAIIAIGMLPYIAIAVPLARYGSTEIAIAACVSGLVTFACYYGTYESLHWIMHDPKDRVIERTRVFRWLNAHHLLHHYDDRGRNFNVVFPFADWCFGTLITRSVNPFPQPTGPAVPDVQPR